MNIVMLRTGIRQIPDAIFEAAELDGSGPLRILFRIVVPLTTSFIVVIILFNGVAPVEFLGQCKYVYLYFPTGSISLTTRASGFVDVERLRYGIENSLRFGVVGSICSRYPYGRRHYRQLTFNYHLSFLAKTF